jgi:glycerate kinase
MAEEMDRWMASFAELVCEKYPQADPSAPGSGAAGGLGFAFRTFTNAVLESGIKIVLEETKLEERIREADLVITGEGRLDAQTVMGKAPVGVAKIAKKYNLPVIAFAGAVTPDAGICNAYGIDAFFSILRRVSTLEEAMEPVSASRNLTDTAEQVMRLFLCRRKTLG